MSIFTGSGVAIVTPMKPDGAVNYEAFAKNIEFQIANHTDAIIVCGTTGEASTLSHEEHLECIKFCVEQVAGRIPVIAGTGSNCTETAVYLSKEAEQLGADGLLVVTPYYNKATQKGLKEHYSIIAKAVKIPIILYNIPGRTGGVNILPETIVSLCEENPNIVGVKDATDNFIQYAKLMALAKGKVDVYSGNDNQIVPFLSLGAKGVISVLANIAPQQTHDICAKYFAGETAESARLQLEAIELIAALFSEVNPIPVKTALNLMDYKVGTPRLPLVPMSCIQKETLKQEMKKLKLI